MDIVKSTLCAVLKEVYVRPIDEYSQKISELPEPFQGALVVNLWLGKDFPHKANELLSQLENSDTHPDIISEEDFANGLESTLKQIHSQLAFRDLSMFDALRGAELESNCEKILELLIKNILAESRSVNLVYFVNSLKGDSFSIAGQGVYFVKKGDKEYLGGLQVNERNFSQIDIETGNVIGSHNFENELAFNYAIIIQGKNSFEDAITFGESKLRNLSSVIHAIYVSNHNKRPMICSGKQRTTLFQLFTSSSGQENYGSSSIPYTFPAYCRDQITLDDECQASILNFFKTSEELTGTRKNRMNVCLHHYNLGLQMQRNTDIAFIHYSIALDALYGTTKGNQKSIVSGILSLYLEGIDNDRAKSLYKLRCSLVHGGVKTIKEWSKYKHYRKKYRREPFHDLQNILAFAILNWK